MKVARVGAPGHERPVVQAADGTWRDLSSITPDIDGAFLAAGLAGVQVDALPVMDKPERFGCPIAKPSKLIGIGLNYHSYASSLGVNPPASPVVFLMAPSSISGPTDPIRPLPDATTTDFEVELGLVIGQRLGGVVDAAEAMRAVAGYVLVNDVTDRQRVADSAGPWACGKSADTYTPVGPWLLTADEVLNCADLPLQLRVDDELLQDETTSGMVFDVPTLLVYLASLMTLEPGDLVCTGTPTGTAATRPTPKPFLRPGHVVELDGGVLGTQRCVVS